MATPLLIGIHDKTKHDSRRQSVYVFEPTGTEQMKACWASQSSDIN